MLFAHHLPTTCAPTARCRRSGPGAPRHVLGVRDVRLARVRLAAARRRLRREQCRLVPRLRRRRLRRPPVPVVERLPAALARHLQLKRRDSVQRRRSCRPARSRCRKNSVQDVMYLAPHASWDDNDDIKSAVMTYGGVATLMYSGRRVLQRRDRPLRGLGADAEPRRHHRRVGRRLSGRQLRRRAARPRRFSHQRRAGARRGATKALDVRPATPSSPTGSTRCFYGAEDPPPTPSTTSTTRWGMSGGWATAPRPAGWRTGSPRRRTARCRRRPASTPSLPTRPSSSIRAHRCRPRRLQASGTLATYGCRTVELSAPITVTWADDYIIVKLTDAGRSLRHHSRVQQPGLLWRGHGVARPELPEQQLQLLGRSPAVRPDRQRVPQGLRGRGRAATADPPGRHAAQRQQDLDHQRQAVHHVDGRGGRPRDHRVQPRRRRDVVRDDRRQHPQRRQLQLDRGRAATKAPARVRVSTSDGQDTSNSSFTIAEAAPSPWEWVARLLARVEWLEDVWSAEPGPAWWDAGTILHATHGGDPWQAQAFGVSADLRSIAFADAAHGCTVGISGVIVATTDGGATWDTTTSGTPWTLDDVTFGRRDRRLGRRAWTACSRRPTVAEHWKPRRTRLSNVEWLAPCDFVDQLSRLGPSTCAPARSSAPSTAACRGSTSPRRVGRSGRCVVRQDSSLGVAVGSPAPSSARPTAVNG